MVVATEVTFLVAPTQVTDDMDELPDIEELDIIDELPIMDELPIDEPLPMVKTPTCDWLPAAVPEKGRSATDDRTRAASLYSRSWTNSVEFRSERRMVCGLVMVAFVMVELAVAEALG